MDAGYAQWNPWEFFNLGEIPIYLIVGLILKYYVYTLQLEPSNLE